MDLFNSNPAQPTSLYKRGGVADHRATVHSRLPALVLQYKHHAAERRFSQMEQVI